jgi:predicted permease
MALLCTKSPVLNGAIGQVTESIMNLDTIRIIFRDAWRSFKPDKLTVGFAIVSMAVGLAAATVTLSIVDAIILSPLPYPAPKEIVELTQPDKSSGRLHTFTYRFFYDAQRLLPGLQSLGAVSYSDLILNLENDSVAVSGVACSASLFDLLKLKPLRGRLFNQTEETGDAGVPVALISEELWRTRYAGDPEILGKIIRLNELSHTIIGVMKAGLRLPPLSAAPEVWIPLASDPILAQVKKMFPSRWDRSAYLFLWARINSGLTIKAAEEQSKATALSLLVQDDPDYSADRDFRIVSIMEQLKSQYSVEIYILILAAFLTLAVACFNVSSLILARSLSQRVEFSVRLALGESRSRIFARILLEGVLISVTGALAGVLGAKLMLRALESTVSMGLLPYREIGLSTQMFTAVFAGAVVCGVAASLWPAIRMVKAGPDNLSNSPHRSSTEGRSLKFNRRIMVVGQVACAVTAFVLLSSLYRSYRNISVTRLGFDADHVLVANLKLPQNSASGERWKRAGALLINNLTSQKGIVSAAVAVSPPITRSLRTSYSIPDNPGQNSGGIADYRVVSPNYFSVLRIPLRKGRLFSDSDNLNGRPVCLLNETLARTRFAEGREIGARIAPLGMEPCEIIGVVGDVASHNLKDRPSPAIYVPFDQVSSDVIQGFMSVLVRTEVTHGGIESHKRFLAQTIRQATPTLPANIQTMAAIVGERSSPERFRAMMMGVVSLIAAMLAACGIYGISANYVVERRRDLTIRLALGATTGYLIATTLGETLILAVIGLLIGLSGSYPLMKVLSGVLYGVTGLEISAIIACTLATMVIVSLSAYFPARRIAGLNVADVLKDV